MRPVAFLTEWHTPARPDLIWNVLSRPWRWPEWWRSFRHAEREDGRCVLTWAPRSGYTLRFTLTPSSIEAPHRLTATLSGEVEGHGGWAITPGEAGTTIIGRWQLRPTPRWMQVLGPVMRPVFTYDHRLTMQDARHGLAQVLVNPVEARQQGVERARG